jgi:hypothetical protein
VIEGATWSFGSFRLGFGAGERVGEDQRRGIEEVVWCGCVLRAVSGEWWWERIYVGGDY